MNNLASMKNCPGGVQGNLNWMPGYIVIMISVKSNWYIIWYSKILEFRLWPDDSDKSLLETANGKNPKLSFFNF